MDNNTQFDTFIQFASGLLDFKLFTFILILYILCLCSSLPYTWYFVSYRLTVTDFGIRNTIFQIVIVLGKAHSINNWRRVHSHSVLPFPLEYRNMDPFPCFLKEDIYVCTVFVTSSKKTLWDIHASQYMFDNTVILKVLMDCLNL